MTGALLAGQRAVADRLDNSSALSFCINASETSKLAKTFCTSSCSLSVSINLKSFSPCSSLTATVLCGFHTSAALRGSPNFARSEEHTSELQSLRHLVCRLLLEKKKH